VLKNVKGVKRASRNTNGVTELKIQATVDKKKPAIDYLDFDEIYDA
jgi:hypothetical protein